MLHDNTSFSREELRFHAIDFESTGLRFGDDPTSVVILHPDESFSAVLRRSGGQEVNVDSVWEMFEDAGFPTGEIRYVDTTEEFLAELGTVLSENLNRSERDVLVFYNGNPTGRQKGFDVPLIRHATLRTGASFPLAGAKYADLMDATGYGEVYVREVDVSSFNKTPLKNLCDEMGIEVEGTYKADYVDAVEASSLTTGDVIAFAEENGLDVPLGTDNSQEALYEAFGGEKLGYDSFESSAEAVSAWQNGEYEAVLAHNLADVVMTQFITERLLEVCAFPRIRTLS